MKRHYSFLLLMLVTALLFSACKAETDVGQDVELALENPPEEETAYPPDESAYPVEDLLPLSEEAYPITKADLGMLVRTWQLATYAENGVESEAPKQTLTFNDDGTYALATEAELEKGSWTTILMAVNSTLILKTDASDTRYYQILALEEDLLNLRTQCEGIQVDEGYLP